MRLIGLVGLLAVAIGAVPRDAAAQSRFFTIERNIDRPGHELRTVPAVAAADCSFACQAENKCRAFTFVRRGAHDPFGRCFSRMAFRRRYAIIAAPRASANNRAVRSIDRNAYAAVASLTAALPASRRRTGSPAPGERGLPPAIAALCTSCSIGRVRELWMRLDPHSGWTVPPAGRIIERSRRKDARLCFRTRKKISARDRR